MIESNLVEGRQDIDTNGPGGLTYGQSVTDGTLDLIIRSAKFANDMHYSLHQLGRYYTNT